MLAEIELPAVLPVTHLSVSSMNLLRRCPQQWKRRYMDREYEPPSGAMIVGSASGAAEATNFQLKIASGEDLPAADVLDAYADEWRERTERDDIQWGEADPEQLRQSGQNALETYHAAVAPSVRPVTVERQFTLRFTGADWGFTGYMDVEDEDGSIIDLKSKAKRMSQADADGDPQPSSYLLARREEAAGGFGTPATGFQFHTMIRTKTPQAIVVPTERTDRQLDAYLSRIHMAAAEIAWRAEQDAWDGAPSMAWWCSAKFCGYHSTCAFGGLR